MKNKTLHKTQFDSSIGRIFVKVQEFNREQVLAEYRVSGVTQLNVIFTPRSTWLDYETLADALALLSEKTENANHRAVLRKRLKRGEVRKWC